MPNGILNLLNGLRRKESFAALQADSGWHALNDVQATLELDGIGDPLLLDRAAAEIASLVICAFHNSPTSSDLVRTL